jgi:hypothetical protein
MSIGFSNTTHHIPARNCSHNPAHDWDQRSECHRMRLESDAANRTRSKQVFSTGEIPHLWAHKVQASARNAQGNLYFENETIYSYGSHFPIARHVTNKAGKRAVLFTTDRTTMQYGGSVTTSSHISSVRSAIPSDVSVFHIPNAERLYRAGEENHAKNLAFFKSNIDTTLVQASRARSSWKREYLHGAAVRNREEYNAYLKFFGLRNKPLAAIPALNSRVLEAIKAKEALRVKAETAKAKKARAEQLARLQSAIGEWRGGSLRSISLPYGTPAMLRINGTELETSQGASVPIAHAKRALVLIRAVVARGEDWTPNGHTCHVGHYRIDRIEANGTVKAGCHVISKDEWMRVAPALDAIAATEQETPNA